MINNDDKTDNTALAVWAALVTHLRLRFDGCLSHP